MPLRLEVLSLLVACQSPLVTMGAATSNGQRTRSALIESLCCSKSKNGQGSGYNPIDSVSPALLDKLAGPIKDAPVLKAAIFLVGGPPGAGKQTLLAKAQKELAWAHNEHIKFIKRDFIEAEPSQSFHSGKDSSFIRAKTGEWDVSRSKEYFDATKAAGGYAFTWEAQDAQLGVPKAELEEHLKVGKRCVIQASSSVVDECISKYASDDVEVYFVNITASSDELMRRLAPNGGENPGKRAARMAQAKENEPEGPHVIQIVNEASVEEGARLVEAAFLGQLKYTLWLGPALYSDFHQTVHEFIKQLAKDCGTHAFIPHITLCPSFKTTQRIAIARTEEVAKLIKDEIRINVIGDPSLCSQRPMRAVAYEVEPTLQVRQATAHARSVFFETDDPRYHEGFAPHCSLLYGNHEASVLTNARKEADELRIFSPECSQFQASRIILAMTGGTAYWCWREVASFDLKHKG